MLASSGHDVEASQPFLEAKERYPEGSEMWARATAYAFDMLKQPTCAEVAKPAWWIDEDLKALSKRVVRAAPKEGVAQHMRALVLSGNGDTWESGTRSLGCGAQGGGHALRAVCGAAPCSSDQGRVQQKSGLVSQQGGGGELRGGV